MLWQEEKKWLKNTSGNPPNLASGLLSPPKKALDAM